MDKCRKIPKGTLEQRPLWTPLALFLGAQGFFMGKVVNLADSPGWVKKVTAGSRWLFFGTGEMGDCEYPLELFVRGCLHGLFQGVEVFDCQPSDFGDFF